MGLFSWFAETSRKSVAASHIQHYFEVSRRLDYFDGDPVMVANRVTELACNRVPELPSKWKGFVLAAAILAIAIQEDDLPIAMRDQYAMALAGMLKAAAAERNEHSYEDQRMLDVAQRTYLLFREAIPSASFDMPKPAPTVHSG